MRCKNPTSVALLFAFLPMALMACASAGVRNVERFVDDGTMARPVSFQVYDFATDADQALTDTFGAGFESEPMSQERREARAVASLLAEQTVLQLRQRGIAAERALPSTEPPETALVVKGQFVTIDEGGRAGRVLIGFGAGNDELQVQFQVYQVADGQLRRIAEADADARGSRRPGMLVPIAAAAATGRAVGAVVSGGLTIKQEVTASGLDDDVARLAEKLAEQAVDFYERQGWL